MTETAAEHHRRRRHREDVDPDLCRQCHRQQAICRGKVNRFDTQLDAWWEAVQINVERGYEFRLRPYLCNWCDQWHLTSRGSVGTKRAMRKTRQALRKEMFLRELERRAAAVGEG